MSLAEPKRKQRIIEDPQNKKWADDKQGFGFKMLQKMGWKEGKGLGANLDGQVEHVKVALKTDSAGLGVSKRDLIEDTYGHTRSYDDLLKSLADGAAKGEEKKSKKNKEKSKKKEKSSSKSKEGKKDKKTRKAVKEKTPVASKRVHRKKFMQGKDMSSYSEAQLKEIFGV